ncbi:MAG TPA: DUF6175 family protein [Bacteroidetes bacterium]|nr:DUF6175 family protein [Candidatus Limimorpha avicola]
MKRVLLLGLLLMVSIFVMGQAKKPILMVIPSDSYCDRNNYLQEFTDETGAVRYVSDYNSIFKSADSEDLRLVIAELSKLFAERGFPLKDLEQTLKSMNNASIEESLLSSSSSGASIKSTPLDMVKNNAQPDIILDLDYMVKTRGPQRFITYVLRAVDAYSNKVIAANSGDGEPSASATVNQLLEVAVLNYIDSFSDQLMAYFEDMAVNGREIVVKLKVWDNLDVNFETEYFFEDEELELVDIIDYWMQDYTVNHAPVRTRASENFINYEQVRIPLYKERKGRQSAIGAREFVNDLRSFLRKDPFFLDSKIYERGLGEVWLIIGEK